MGAPRFIPDFKEETVRQITGAVIPLPKYVTVGAFPRKASTNGYGLSSLITANSMPGIDWKPRS